MYFLSASGVIDNSLFAADHATRQGADQPFDLQHGNRRQERAHRHTQMLQLIHGNRLFRGNGIQNRALRFVERGDSCGGTVSQVGGILG